MDPEESEELVLLIEDNPADVFLVREALREHDVRVCLKVLADGEEAVRWVEETGSSPGRKIPEAVVLDLNLPKKNGAEVLAKLRAETRLRDVPVIICSSSNSRDDRALTMKLGATRYFRKPADFDEFLRLGSVIKEVLHQSERKDLGDDREGLV